MIDPRPYRRSPSEGMEFRNRQRMRQLMLAEVDAIISDAESKRTTIESHSDYPNSLTLQQHCSWYGNVIRVMRWVRRRYAQQSAVSLPGDTDNAAWNSSKS